MKDRSDPAAAPDLVALVGSRIAHDLASPIGAIANGVELLGLSGLDASPELALIGESVDNASSRIKLFRIAFGAAAPGQIVPQAEIRALTTAPGGTRAPVIDWQPVGDVPRDAAKLALLALMCLETAMPWGGAVSVRHDAARWIVTGRAERLNIDAALWRGLGDAAVAAPVTAAQVQFRLLPAEVAAQGRVLTVTITETTLEIRF